MKFIDKSNFTQYDNSLFEYGSITKNPKLSICLITYNQAHYMRQTLESIVTQKVNFEYEIVVGDDCSTDDNVKIIKEYMEKYPKLIKGYFHSKNLGPVTCPSKNNFLHAFFNCSGEYIIHIEGDDYFIDSNKIQQQVDFLDANPEYSACFHNAKIIWEDWPDRPDEFVNQPNQKPVIGIDDLLAEKETWFMATASVMMRRKYVYQLPSWFYDTVSGDIPLYVILASQGKIGYLPQVMSVYRKNLAGQSFVWKLHQTNFVKNRIQLYKNLNNYTKLVYNHKIEPILADYYYLLAKSNDLSNDLWSRILYTLKGIFYSKNFSYQFIKFKIWEYIFQWKPLNTRTFINLILKKNS